MSDDAATGNGNEVPPTPRQDTEPEPPEIEIEYVTALPGGRAVMPVERDGTFAWLVVEGHISRQARGEMLADLSHLIRTGRWRQNWQPPGR